MITSSQQALAVQTRRHSLGKKGFSKAVRAWAIRTLETRHGPKEGWSAQEWETYHTIMSALPHRF